MKPYVSIFAEAGKPKIVIVKSNKGTVYKIANFPAVLGKDFVKFISEKNLDSYAIDSNTIASDVYFSIVQNKSNREVTISVVCEKTEFVRYVSDEIWTNWMVKTGTEFSGTSQDDSGMMIDKYKFKPEKGLKWFKDTFLNKGFIAVGDYFYPEAYTLGENDRSINKLLDQPITSASPDVAQAKAAMSSSSSPKPAAKKKVVKPKVGIKGLDNIDEDDTDAKDWITNNESDFLTPDKGASKKKWVFKEFKPFNWNSFNKVGQQSDKPTIQELLEIQNLKILGYHLSKIKKTPIAWSKTEFGDYALAYNFKDKNIYVFPKDKKLSLSVEL